MKRTTFCALAIALSSGMLVLTGCNGAEDFSDAVIGGGSPIDPRPDPAPIPGPDEQAVEVELVVGVEHGGVFKTANIANLHYICTEAIGTIPATGKKPFIARCAPTADRIEFFVGGKLLGDRRISLGVAHLPLCTGRSGGSAGQSGCAGGSGFFQVSVADLVPASSLDPSPKPLSAPARRAASDAKVLNRAAFLAALDDDSDPRRITIADQAHNSSANAPVTDFSQDVYEDFRTYWSAWMTEIGKTLPVSSVSAQSMAKVAMDRTRIGLYSLEHDGVTYKAAFPTEAQLGRLSVVLPFIVMPDGSAGGVGALFGSSGSGASLTSEVDLVALKSGARLDDSLLMLSDGDGNIWRGEAVLDPSNTDDLRFRGRLLGASAYDHKVTSSNKTDYRLDFPTTGIYVPQNTDWARFSAATVFDQSYSEAPYRISRTGYAGAVLDEAKLAQLPAFYRITLYKACVVPLEAECQDIPEEEIGAGLNYPEFIDNDNCDPRNAEPSRRPTQDNGDDGGCSDNDEALDLKTQQGVYIGKEKPRGGASYAFASGSFNVQFLSDGSIITDRRGQCRPLVNTTTLTRDDGNGGTDTEVRVGYVSRTLADNPADDDDVAEDTANVLIFMTGSASNGNPAVTGGALPPVPHYGTQIQGRIRLADPQRPMRRLGDDNFKDGVRAFWQDFYQAGRLAETFGDTAATGTDGHRIRALQGGAAEGVALDGVVGTCAPVPAAP